MVKKDIRGGIFSSATGICTWTTFAKPKLCYIDTDSFLFYIKTEYIGVDITKDVETRFDTSKYELEKSLPRGKIKKLMLLKLH